MKIVIALIVAFGMVFSPPKATSLYRVIRCRYGQQVIINFYFTAISGPVSVNAVGYGKVYGGTPIVLRTYNETKVTRGPVFVFARMRSIPYAGVVPTHYTARITGGVNAAVTARHFCVDPN